MLSFVTTIFWIILVDIFTVRMRFWLAKSSEVPIREQLVTQIILGVVSNDLKSGQRLPSTRELARRHRIHANTVSAAYRELANRGWVDFRRGSGVYVRAGVTNPPLDGSLELDQLTSIFLKAARSKGHSLSEIQARLRHWLALEPPDHFLVIEPDPELRRILVVEIEQATGARVIGTGLESEMVPDLLIGALPVTMFGQVERVRDSLPPGMDLISLRSRSVPDSMKGEKRPSHDDLVAVVSGWPEFLRWSRTILVAAGLNPDALSFRDGLERDWDRGLRSALFVITDSRMAQHLPPGCKVKIFRIISDESLGELHAFVKDFFLPGLTTNPPL